MIRVTVPATSANLGVSYDTLGMAVTSYARFTFERAETLSITGCPVRYRNERNLVNVSFSRALETWGERIIPLAIDIETEIPVARARLELDLRRRRHHRSSGAHRVRSRPQ